MKIYEKEWRSKSNKILKIYETNKNSEGLSKGENHQKPFQ